jgi:hypothetical protein
MEKIASYCLTEPGSGSDAAALKTTRAARRRSLHPQRHQAVHLGRRRNDIYVCMVRTGDDGPKGISCLVVEKDTPGLSSARREEAGLERPAHRAGDLRGLPRAGGQPGRRGRRGLPLAMAGLDGGRLNIGACSLGGAQRCLDEAIKPMPRIASSSASRSPISRTPSSCWPTWRPIWKRRARCSTSPPQGHRQCARTRPALPPWPSALATDTGSKVVNDALQMFGGYGYLRTIRSSASGAICASTAFSKAPTRSCA